MADKVVVDGLWQEYRPRNAHGSRRRGAQTWALRDVSLAAGPGERVGVLGHNGSGKTTLLKTLAGVIRPTRGTVWAGGRVSPLLDLNAGVSRDLSGAENILIGGVLLGMSRREVRAKFDQIAAFSGLSAEELTQPISTYSAGMGLRIGFSLVVHSEPAVLLVDEVLAVGDEEFQRAGLERIEELRRDGCVVIVASHDLALVERFCDRVVVLAEGEVTYNGAAGSGIALHQASPRPETPTIRRIGNG